MPELLAQVERGDLVPWQVTLPPLPAKAGCNVRAVADDLAHLFGVQAAAGDDRPLLYASRWASARLGIDREVVSRALRCLVKGRDHRARPFSQAAERWPRGAALLRPGRWREGASVEHSPRGAQLRGGGGEGVRECLRRDGVGGVTARTGGETMAVAPVPRLALTREEAAAALGMSLDSFERHVQPTLRLVRLGRMRLVPIAELERWLEENASGTLDGAA
jgi:hypothetical protein